MNDWNGEQDDAMAGENSGVRRVRAAPPPHQFIVPGYSGIALLPGALARDCLWRGRKQL